MRKSFVEIFSFIWVFFVIFFLGIYLIFFGIKDLTYSQNKMIKESGIITHIEEINSSIYIKLNSFPYKYKTTVSKKIHSIINKLKKGDEITIYRRYEDVYFIQKIVKDKLVIVEYKKLIFFSGIILCVGLGLVFFSIYYLIRKVKQNYGEDAITSILHIWNK